MQTINFRQEAVKALEKSYLSNKNGIIAASTGFGKTKVAIDFIKLFIKKYKRFPKVLIVTPTEQLRDVDWKNEFIKFRCKAIFDLFCDAVCYASLSKIKSFYDLIILDEVHHLTESHYQKLNTLIKHKSFLVGLTATVPKNKDKIDLLKSLNFTISFKFKLDEAIDNNIVSDYNIYLIPIELDNTKLTYKAFKTGNAKMTEKAKYNQCDMYIDKANGAKWSISNRMHFIYNSESKTTKAKELISYIDNTKKTIIFSGSIAQAELLCKDTFHSKSKKDTLDLFRNNKINKLSCVDALNEGINITNIDIGIITQIKANDKVITQQIGRLLRGTSKAIIFILYLKNTQDEKWLNQALVSFDKNKIITIETEKEIKQILDANNK